MTREEVRTALGDRNNLLWGMSKEEKEYYSEALDMAIKALSVPEREKGEYIKKDNAIAEFKAQKDAWEYYGESFYNEKYIKFDNVIDTIRELPTYSFPESSFPEREKGKWIYDNKLFIFHCSKCNFATTTNHKYCVCGADMRS